MNVNAHVHFQGNTDLTAKQLDTAITELARTHYLKKHSPNSKPVRRVHGTVTVVGYQYLSKEGRDPLYSQGFSAADLAALREASATHVEELKCGMPNHIFSLSYSAIPADAFNAMRLDALEYYDSQDKRPGPRFQKDVLWAMYKHPSVTDAWKFFVSERI